jgi:hypothetical protein
MQKLRNNIFFLFLITSISAKAQNSDVIRRYVDEFKEIAISEMLRTGVPASVTLAQGIHETAAGTSSLVLKSNNHFGIKCKSDWAGESVKHDDDARGECFRKYTTPDNSYRDHSDFLKSNRRYATLFKLDPTDYAGWAHGLKAAGYATNPKYAALLIRLIEDYQLQDYTLIALGTAPQQEAIIAAKTNVTDVPIVAEVPVAISKQVEKAIEVINYPDGEFKIYETRVIYIKKGTSFLSVATQYDIDLSKIFDFNEIQTTEESAIDQLIYLQRKRKTGSEEFHIVKAGETLHGIAQKEAIRMESLMELNGLALNEMPAVGEQLNLKQKSGKKPNLAVNNAE